MSTPREGDREYTIDELAAASQVPSRTIRFYQSKAVLPRPELRGRMAYYGAAHLERLKLIASLQERGLRIDAIRELTARLDKGELDLNEWLGLDAQLQTSWVNDQPRILGEDEIREMAGPSPRRDLLSALLRAEIIVRQGNAFLVKSPALLSVALKLEQAGVAIEINRGAEEILRKHLSRAALGLAEHFFQHAEKGFAGNGGPGAIADLFQALRSLGPEAVRIIFSQEMEKTLRELSGSGKTATLPVNRKKAGQTK